MQRTHFGCPVINDVVIRSNAMPIGYFTAQYEGRRYGVTKSQSQDGKQGNLVARALGGADYISLNLNQLAFGPWLRPCEMSAQKVTGFIRCITLHAELISLSVIFDSCPNRKPITTRVFKVKPSPAWKIKYRCNYCTASCFDCLLTTV